MLFIYIDSMHACPQQYACIICVHDMRLEDVTDRVERDQTTGGPAGLQQERYCKCKYKLTTNNQQREEEEM